MSNWREKFSKSYAYHLRNGLARFLAWLSRQPHAPKLAEELNRLPMPQPREVVATREELQRLYDHAVPWMRCYLLICSTLALRFEEARTLSPAHYNAERKTVTLRTKGDKPHTLPVPTELAEMFEQSPHDDDPNTPYIIRWKGSPASPQCVHDNWWRLKKRAGVNPRLRIHDLRRTAATALYDATKDIRAVQQLLGHRHISTSARYVQGRDPETLRPLMADLRWLKPRTEVKQ